MKNQIVALGLGMSLGAVSTNVLALDEIRINGFLTAAGTTTDADSAYNIDLARDDLRFDGRDNRLGLQIAADINERMNVTAQLISRGGPDNYNVEADWAFVGYQVHDQLAVRAGKVKLPTFLASDYIEVGYAYPWVRPPQEVYSLNPITSLSGVDLLYTPVVGDVTLLFQPYFGTSQGTGYTSGQQEVDTSGLGFPAAGTEVEFDAKELAGINFAVQTDIATFRAGYLSTKVSSPFGGGLIDEDKAEFMSVGFTMDWNDVVAYAEWASRDEDDGAEIGFPDQQAWYATLGYRVGQFLPSITYAELKAGSDEVSWAQEQSSIAFDLRYELGLGADLKFQAMSVRPENGKVGLYDGPVSSDELDSDAMVYSVALDVIF